MPGVSSKYGFSACCHGQLLTIGSSLLHTVPSKELPRRGQASAAPTACDPRVRDRPPALPANIPGGSSSDAASAPYSFLCSGTGFWLRNWPTT